MTREIKFLTLACLLVASLSCQPSSSSTPTAPETPPQTGASPEQLFVRNCKSCHGPGSLSAPVLADMRKVYAEGTDQAGFSAAMLNFLKDPSKENSKMPIWIDKYGPMPKLSIPEADLTQIVDFIYQQKSESGETSTRNPDGSINYLMQGKEFAMKTKAVLSKNLLGAIESKGTAEAVSFCNSKAYPLTDSMALALGTKIKRVSDQPRNHNNRASIDEREVILEMKTDLMNGMEAKPRSKELPGKFIGYYPITTNKMCLQCHGVMEKDVAPEVLDRLSKLYTNDLAYGYKENQIRGMWVVEMKR